MLALRRARRSPPRHGQGGGGDVAAMAITGFAIAVAIYAVAFVVFIAAVEAPNGAHKEGPVLASRADGGLDTLLNSVGQLSTGGAKWTTDPDNVTRLGLGQAGLPDHLDLDKMRNLTRGNMSKSGNGLLDYPEARAALGLGEYDFHLRSYPLLSSLDDGGLKPLKGLKVAYLGDFAETGGGGAGDKVVNRTHEVRDMGGFVFVNITVQNNGTTGAVFQASYSWVMAEATLTDTANTPWLAPDPTGVDPASKHNVSVKLYKTTTWAWGGSDRNVSVTLSDKGTGLGSFKVDLAGVNMASGGAANGDSFIEASADKVYYRSNDKPKVVMGVYDGRGDDVDNVVVNATVRYAANGTIAKSWQGDIDGGDTWNLNDQLPLGNYTVWVNTTGNWSFHNADWFQVTDDPGAFQPGGTPSSWIESDASKYERGLVAALVDGWRNTTYNITSGDVYPDIKDVMNNDLATNLSAGNFTNYRVLIVGSGVDHNAMTSASAKHAVRDFVLNGGLLIVLGSSAQHVSWLQPLFHSSLSTSGGGVDTPDTSHPLLHVPEELRYTTYPDNGLSWKYNNDADTHFTHVLTRAGTSPPEDTLSVSKPGHFGNGTIVLAGWQLHNLTVPQDDHEAKKVLYNFLSQALGQLFIDFGPPIPSRAEVASTTRMATAPHPGLPGEEVLVRMVLYVFR